jgi:hypothetical protein
MKKQTPPRVPSVVMAALQETASRFDGSELEFVLTAATWAYCRQDAATRRSIVEDFWFSGSSALEASGVDRSHKTLKEKVHALAANCYAALRRRLAQ